MEVWGGNQAVDSGVVMAGLDAWAYSKPWQDNTAGGDVHYVSSCASGRIMRLLVADVAGHGGKVAETAQRLRQLMKRFVNHLDQRTFVAELNSEFAGVSSAGRFATAAVFTFFTPTNHLTISNAGHPPPLLYRSRSRTWEIVTPETNDAPKPGPDAPANLPLGIADAPRYDALPLKLNVGDLVLSYTDSLIEAHGGDGRMLGPRGLLEIVQRIEMTDPAAFIPALLKAIADEAPGNLDGDDVTVLLFRPNGLGLKFSLRERLGTYRRVMGAAGRAIIGRERFPWPDSHIANVGGAVFSRLSQRWKGE
jgi:serine phosphatase RsbU (regulator of sigma subunit)